MKQDVIFNLTQQTGVCKYSQNQRYTETPHITQLFIESKLNLPASLFVLSMLKPVICNFWSRTEELKHTAGYNRHATEHISIAVTS